VDLLALERKHQHQTGVYEEDQYAPLSHLMDLHSQDLHLPQAMVAQEKQVYMKDENKKHRHRPKKIEIRTFLSCVHVEQHSWQIGSKQCGTT